MCSTINPSSRACSSYIPAEGTRGYITLVMPWACHETEEMGTRMVQVRAAVGGNVVLYTVWPSVAVGGDGPVGGMGGGRAGQGDRASVEARQEH